MFVYYSILIYREVYEVIKQSLKFFACFLVTETPKLLEHLYSKEGYYTEGMHTSRTTKFIEFKHKVSLIALFTHVYVERKCNYMDNVKTDDKTWVRF